MKFTKKLFDMNVAIFSTEILWTLEYASDLEIMQQHIYDGDNVTHLFCNASLPACDANPYMTYDGCQRCIAKRELSYEAVNGNFVKKLFLTLTEEDKRRIAAIPVRFDSVKELQSLMLDNFELGYAAASSVISVFRNPQPDLKHEMIEGFLKGAAAVYFSVINYLKKNPTDRFYVFNGRMAHARAALRACEKMGVDYYTHERGNSVHHFITIKNGYVHMVSLLQDIMKQQWENADPHQRVAIGESFYVNRRQGKVESRFEFTSGQKAILPEKFDKSKRNIVIYNSSEDEFASLGTDWKNHVYETQLSGLVKIKADACEWTDTHFYLRIHPNLKNVSKVQQHQLEELSGGNFTVIPAKSEVSTYELLFAADVIFSFGSSMGIEAVFWGIPSIVAGKFLYRGLGGTYEPDSHQEVLSLLRAKLDPLPKEAALILGYYFMTCGKPYKYFKSENNREGAFNGVSIEDKLGIPQKLISKLVNAKMPFSMMEHLRSWNRRRRIHRFEK